MRQNWASLKKILDQLGMRKVVYVGKYGGSRWPPAMCDGNQTNACRALLRHLPLAAVGLWGSKIFTIEAMFSPGLSVDEVKKLSLECVSPIPREMAYPLPKGQRWHNHYQFIKYAFSKYTLG